MDAAPALQARAGMSRTARRGCARASRNSVYCPSNRRRAGVKSLQPMTPSRRATGQSSPDRRFDSSAFAQLPPAAQAKAIADRAQAEEEKAAACGDYETAVEQGEMAIRAREAENTALRAEIAALRAELGPRRGPV